MHSNLHETQAALTGPTRDLSVLLELSNVLSSSRHLDEVLNILARKMAELVEATYCRISLLEESDSCLAVRGFYALRNWDGESGLGVSYSLTSLPQHQQVINLKEHRVIPQDRSTVSASELESKLMFEPLIQSVLLMPLMVKESCLGVATLGEMRSQARTGFTDPKIELCRAMANQGTLAIENIRAFESIANRNQETQLILNSVTDGVFRSDVNGRILNFNRSAEKLTGYPTTAMLGRTCADQFQGQDTDGYPLCETKCPIHQVLKGGSDAKPLESTESILRADGTRVALIHNVAPVFDSKKQIIGAVSVLRDVSTEQELIRLKSEFIALVSHQLRTPLAAISASAELLATSDMDRSVEKELLQIINHQCQQLNQLVNQVLESSRLEKGRIKLDLEPIALVPLMQQVVRAYRGLHPDCNILVQTSSLAPIVLGDQNSVKVILENLLVNAINYSPVGGTVTLSVEDDDDAVIVTVADQGSGISPDEIDSVFLPYRRGVNVYAQPANGFGLGLYIAKMLVIAQGGRIWVASQLGQGAQFRFTVKKVRNP